MSGVHASCVEAWIVSYRQTHGADEWPKCSVCGAPYSGKEEKPGALDYLAHGCFVVLWNTVRVVLLAAAICGYWLVAGEGSRERLTQEWQRVALLVALSVYFLYKAAVLAASLPPGMAQPEGITRFLFVQKRKYLLLTVLELSTSIFTLSFWSLLGLVQFQHVLPLMALPILAMLGCLFKQGAPREQLVAAIGGAAAFWRGCSQGLRSMTTRDLERWISPAGPVFHSIFPLATLVLSFAISADLLLIALWAGHSLFLLLAILDQLFNRIPWQGSSFWWLYPPMVFLVACVANLMHCQGDKHQFGHGECRDERVVDTQSRLFLASVLWFLLTLVFSLLINRNLLKQKFKNFQARHAQFSLATSSGNEARGSSNV